jgi:hypothetical protein
VTPKDVIEHIDAFLARPLESGVTEGNQHFRRQASHGAVVRKTLPSAGNVRGLRAIRSSPADVEVAHRDVLIRLRSTSK